MTKTPQKHAATIKAWADGEEIEFRAPNSTAWIWSPAPAWVEDYEYRVKPARSYPETLMEGPDLYKAYIAGRHNEDPIWSSRGCQQVANAAIRHAIDNGQVVTREEFALAIGDRERRDWIVAEEVKRACILTLSTQFGQHNHSQTVLRGLNLAPIVEGLKK